LATLPIPHSYYEDDPLSQAPAPARTATASATLEPGARNGCIRDDVLRRCVR